MRTNLDLQDPCVCTAISSKPLVIGFFLLKTGRKSYVYLSGEEITRQAAYLALAIYAEHVADAHSHPGKHGNIDRLLDIVTSGKTLVGEIFEKDQEAAATE